MSGTSSSPTCSPASATATASMVRGRPTRACGATPPSSCSTRTPRRSRERSGWDEAVFGHRWADPDQRNDNDSASFMPRSVVVNPFFDWDGDRPLRTRWADTVIYETHVHGATIRHPEVPEELRAPTAGSPIPPSSTTSRASGVTAVELMPVHQFVNDAHLVDRGLRNYWGYNSIGFLAPHNAYATRGQAGEQVQEFRQMVQGPTRRGHRGDPRRRLQPLRRGQPPRPDAELQGLRQPDVLPARRGRSALLLRLHGHRATRSTCAARTPCSW